MIRRIFKKLNGVGFQTLLRIVSANITLRSVTSEYFQELEM